MAEFLKVVKYDQAVENIRQHFPSRRIETLSLLSASGRLLAQDIMGPEDLPSFDRSTVDGYAVRAEDSFGSSESLPAYLDYQGEVKMGEMAGIKIGKGQCGWIPTGGMMPLGTDAVVMVEYTERLGDDIVLIYRPVGPGENLMLKGEDVKKGQPLFKPGKILRPQDIGFLASLGIDTVEVYQPYKIGIISTGDEIVPIDVSPSGGQIRDVNTHALASAVHSWGNIPCTYPIVKDEFQSLNAVVLESLEENDILLMSGGSSVGIKDVTIDVLLSIPGSELLFHGLAVKPGKPTLAVKVNEKLIIGLPGHPVSALMMLNIICSPLIKPDKGQTVMVQVTQNIASQPGRDDFVPVVIEEDDKQLLGRPLLGKSGLMSILSMADAFIHIPYEDQGVLAGSIVSARLF